MIVTRHPPFVNRQIFSRGNLLSPFYRHRKASRDRLATPASGAARDRNTCLTHAFSEWNLQSQTRKNTSRTGERTKWGSLLAQWIISRQWAAGIRTLGVVRSALQEAVSTALFRDCSHGSAKFRPLDSEDEACYDIAQMCKFCIMLQFRRMARHTGAGPHPQSDV